jgi:hypothetical protein
VEGSVELLVVPFPNGGPDMKLVCGACQSPQPLGAVINGKIHYRRKQGAECWVDSNGFRVICSNCGTPGHISWDRLQ